jgi:hypothetical protein
MFPPYMSCIFLTRDIQANPQLSVLQSKSDELYLVLEYLVSNQDLTNIIGLPLIRLANEEFVSLLSSLDRSVHEVHTLLQQEDCKIFQDLDNRAIALHTLPSSVADLLLKGGLLNVGQLIPQRVVEYLRLSMKRFGIDLGARSPIKASPKAIEWFISLWKWIGGWHANDSLYKLICDIPLVPTSDDLLVSPQNGVFSNLTGSQSGLRNAMEILGISFLHFRVNASARNALDNHRVVRSPDIIHDLLDGISLPLWFERFETNVAEALRTHLALQLPRSSLISGPLNEYQISKLYALPIYPILVPPTLPTTNPNAALQIGVIPSDKRIICVESMRLLPIIPDVIFVEKCQSLLHNAESMPVDKILSFAIDNLPAQPKHLQCAFIAYLVTHMDSTPPKLLRNISETSFVTVGEGSSYSSPRCVIDPESELGSLLDFHDRRMPLVSGADNIAIVDGLRRLGLLQAKLDKAFVEERIKYISRTSGSEDLSRRLVRLIVKSRFDCSTLQINHELRWLPTAIGNRGPRQCHHRDAHRLELFDEVLPILDVLETSTSLRSALRWNDPLALDTVKKQFAKVLKSQQCAKLVVIIKEFGRRVNELSDKDCSYLREIIGGRAWIPISRDCIAPTSRALLSPSPPSLSGFNTIPSDLTDVARQFFERMGCEKRYGYQFYATCIYTKLGVDHHQTH